MKLMKQVLSDISKEIGWVVLYGFLTAMVIMTFILISLSYQYVASQDGAISRFVNRGIAMARLQSIQFSLPSQTSPEVADGEASESLEEYYADVFSYDGNAGTFVMIPECHGYRQAIILLGVYAELTPFSEMQTDAVTFAVSVDKKDAKPDTIVINQTAYPLYVVPDDMEIYHPLFYMGGKSGALEDTLFVFSHDFKAVREIFSDFEYGWELQEDSFLDRFIFEDVSDSDVARLREVVTQNIGGYVSVQNMEDFLKSSADGGTRTHRIYLLFYITASMVLLGAMLLNVRNVLRRKMPDYAVHYLFGASESFLFARMFLFVLLYHAIPLGGIVWILSLN